MTDLMMESADGSVCVMVLVVSESVVRTVTACGLRLLAGCARV